MEGRRSEPMSNSETSAASPVARTESRCSRRGLEALILALMLAGGSRAVAADPDTDEGSQEHHPRSQICGGCMDHTGTA